MTRFCAACGAPVQPGTSFCGGCGKPLPAAAAPPPAPPPFSPPPGPPPPPRPPAYAPPPPPAYSAPPPVPPPAASWSPQPPPQPGYYAPPPSPAPAGAPAEGGLPASPQPWGFQVSVAGAGDNIVRSMGLAKADGQMGWLEMFVRGAFLDARVYRQAALGVNGNGGAILALLVPYIASAIGSSLISLSFAAFLGRFALYTMVVSTVIGIGAAVVGLVVMSALSQAIVGWKLSLGQLFRALAYAQSPGVAGIIPFIGWLIGLWRIPTSLVAIREISGADGGKAAILLVVGGLAMVVLSLVLTPLLLAGGLIFR